MQKKLNHQPQLENRIQRYLSKKLHGERMRFRRSCARENGDEAQKWRAFEGTPDSYKAQINAMRNLKIKVQSPASRRAQFKSSKTTSNEGYFGRSIRIVEEDCEGFGECRENQLLDRKQELELFKQNRLKIKKLIRESFVDAELERRPN